MLELVGSGGDPVLGRVLASLLFPPLTIALQLAIVAIVRRCSASAATAGRAAFMPGASHGDIAILVTIVTLSAQQFAVSRAFLEAFACVDVNGVSYLAQDTAVECGSPQHRTLLALAIPGFALYAVLFPTALLFKLVSVSGRLSSDEQVMRRYSFLTKGFGERAYLWEIVVSFRRLLLRLGCTVLCT